MGMMCRQAADWNVNEQIAPATKAGTVVCGWVRNPQANPAEYVVVVAAAAGAPHLAIAREWNHYPHLLRQYLNLLWRMALAAPAIPPAIDRQLPLDLREQRHLRQHVEVYE